jgi:6-phosphogluconolactonase
VFSIDAVSGALTAVTGSPFATSGNPWGIFSDASDKFLYGTDVSTETVQAYTINGSTRALRR